MRAILLCTAVLYWFWNSTQGLRLLSTTNVQQTERRIREDIVATWDSGGARKECQMIRKPSSSVTACL